MYNPQSRSIRIGENSISLDEPSGDICFVSHAHSDHTSAFSKKKPILASEETFIIAGASPCKRSIPGLSLHHAGHMLGARQLLASLDGHVFAYTGDFSLQDSYTAKAAEILKCDTLMIDSTYCVKGFSFPKRYNVLMEMEKFVKQNSDAIIVFGAYSTGKAQELVCFLNRECGVAPLVEPSAAKVCRAYQKCGVRLDYVERGSPEATEIEKRAHVSIVPLQKANFSYGALLSQRHGMKVKTAAVTGWAARRKFPCDASFPLSDHADFNDTLRYIYESGAKKVICANANSQLASLCLRSMGIDAVEKETAELSKSELFIFTK